MFQQETPVQQADGEASLIATSFRTLPGNWCVVRLGDVTNILDKRRVPLNETQRQVMRGPYPYCGANGVLDYINDYLFDGEYVLLAEDGGYWGAFESSAYLMSGSFWVNNHAHILEAIPEVADNEFLVYVLNFSDIARYISGTTRGKLTQGVMQELVVPLPPLPEQRAIARALRAVQDAIQVRRREVELERERKAALMQRLFTHGTRGEPTKQTEIGEMPESWRVVMLGEVARIERGKFTQRPRNDPAFYGGNVPFIQTGDVTACDGHIRAYTQTLNERGMSVSKMFPKGTIVITIAANIGYTGILEFDSAFPDSLIGITPQNEVDVEYLNYYLTTQQPKMDMLAPRGTQKNINIEFLSPWPVTLPSPDEQRDIACSLAACCTRTAVLERETLLLEELFRALLEELMTGRLSALPLVEASEVAEVRA